MRLENVKGRFVLKIEFIRLTVTQQRALTDIDARNVPVNAGRMEFNTSHNISSTERHIFLLKTVSLVRCCAIASIPPNCLRSLFIVSQSMQFPKICKKTVDNSLYPPSGVMVVLTV